MSLVVHQLFNLLRKKGLGFKYIFCSYNYLFKVILHFL